MAIATDWRKARLSTADYAMLEFGEKLTLMPSLMTDDDVAALQRHFSDSEILAITFAAAYRNFITRVADGLGVELGTTANYGSEVLRAFGVTEAAVGGTLYADRLAPTSEPSETRRSGTMPVARSSNRTCALNHVIHEGSATDQLCREAAQFTQPYALTNLFSAMSLRSDSLKATINFARRVDLGGSRLGRRIEAIIGQVVAASLWLPYLGVHHVQSFLDTGGTLDEVHALLDNPAGGGLSGAERALAVFAEKLTRTPGRMARADIEVMREAGFDDLAIVTAVAAIAFANYLGRVAAGLCVRMEESFNSRALAVFGDSAASA